MKLTELKNFCRNRPVLAAAWTAGALIVAQFSMPARAQAAELHVYVNATMTGARGYLGLALLQAANAFAERANGQGGFLKQRIRIIAQDDELDVEKSLANATKAIADPEHFLTIGATNSKIALPTAKLFFKAKKLFVTVFATHTELSAIGGTVLQTCFNNAYEGRVLAQYSAKDLKSKKILVLANQADPYSENLATEYLTHLDKKVTSHRLDYVGGTSITPALTELLKTFKPDLIFVPAIRDRAAEVIRETTLLSDARIMGSDGWGTQEQTKEIYFTTDKSQNREFIIPFHWDPLANTKLGKEFEQRIMSVVRNLEHPYAASMLAYEALHIIGQAVEQSKSTDAETLIRTIRGKSYDGAVGQVTFDANGVTNRPLVLLSLRKTGVKLLSVVRETKQK